LSNCVVVWTFDQDRAREWIVNTFDKGVFVVSK
jgi:hypothetical protein